METFGECGHGGKVDVDGGDALEEHAWVKVVLLRVLYLRSVINT